eukprot:jgi/Chrzof1/5014/Cz15g08170.t1
MPCTCRAVYSKGVGPQALARYLQEANQEVDVWLQVETKDCFEAIDDILSIPGIDCAFLGPADMGFSYGLHVKNNYDLSAMLASPELDHVYSKVIATCTKYGIQPGVFCLGQQRAQKLAAQGYKYVAYDVDLNVMINYSMLTMAALKES